MRVDIKTMREKRSLSQTELAKRSTVPQAMISQIESGTALYPQINTLYKLAVALRCSVDDFIVNDGVAAKEAQ